MKSLRRLVPLAAAIALIGAACGGDGDDDQPTGPPTQVTMVASGSFQSPMDAVASPDGSTFYFTAFTADGEPAVYEVASSGGTASPLTIGDPLERPSGLVASCDGATLYVADIGYQPGEDDAVDGGAPIHTLDTATGALAPFGASGVGEAAGLALSIDCETLYATGYTDTGRPALFAIPTAGGSASVVAAGDPLVSPSGVHVDVNGVAWVMDHQPDNGMGGVLFAIDPDGAITEVVGGLRISEPAGVSLISAGGIAVIPNRDLDDRSHLLTVDTATGDRTIVEADEIIEPAGIRTARDAPVMAVVDNDGNAIYRAE